MRATLPRLPVWLQATAFVLLLGVLVHAAQGFFNPIDFPVWGKDWASVSGCLAAEGVLPCGGVSKFPLAYLLNARIAGGSEVVLATMNVLFLLLPVAYLAALRGWRVALAAGCVHLLAIAVSPLPAFYVRSGALEVQAGVVIGIFIASLALLLLDEASDCREGVLRGVLFVSAMLAPLYKDTIVVLLAVSICLIWALRCVGRPRSEWLPSRDRSRSLALYAALPLGIGLLASLAYNLFRYGSPWPVGYFQEAAQTAPSLVRSFEFFVGSILSPNGGIAVFWLLSFAAAVAGWRWLGLRTNRWATGLAGLMALLSALAFARWWAPFGWDAWGDRLMIQPMLALLVVMLVGVTRATATRSGAALSWMLVLAAIPGLAASAYYVALPYTADRGQMMGRSLWSGPACQHMMTRLQSDAPAMGFAFWTTDDYYRCARERMLHVPAPDFNSRDNK